MAFYKPIVVPKKSQLYLSCRKSVNSLKFESMWRLLYIVLYQQYTSTNSYFDFLIFYFNKYRVFIKEKSNYYKRKLYLPTIISSLFVALGRSLVQISHVNNVLELLNTDVSEDIRAATMHASNNPISKDIGSK